MQATLFLALSLPLLALSFQLLPAGRVANPMGQVEGAEACGGNSLFLNMDLSTCDQAPCDVIHSTGYDIGISFYAGETTTSIQWLTFLYYPNGGVSRLSDKRVEGTLESGMGYRVNDTITVPARFDGIDGELSVMIMNAESGERMVCGIFPVKVVSD